MEISEQELRSMIRGAIARAALGVSVAEPSVDPAADRAVRTPDAGHASHGLLPVLPGGDGACIIEPAVRCNHCGYCRSLGH